MLFDIAKDIDPVAHAKVTAGLYIKNELISIGWCQYRTSPFALKYGKNAQSLCIHAENGAIKQALHRYSVDDLENAKTILYIARAKRFEVGSSWVWGLSAPCNGCMRLIADFNIKRVVYTLNESEPGIKMFEELP